MLQVLGLKKYADKIYYKLTSTIYEEGFSPLEKAKIKKSKKKLNNINIINLIKDIRKELEG